MPAKFLLIQQQYMNKNTKKQIKVRLFDSSKNIQQHVYCSLEYVLRIISVQVLNTEM